MKERIPVLKDLNTRAKVVLIFIPIIILMSLQAVMVFVFVERLNRDVRRMEEHRIETVLTLNEFMQELSANQQRYQLLADQENTEIPFEDLVYEVFEAEEVLQDDLREVQQLLADGTAAHGVGDAAGDAGENGAAEEHSDALLARLLAQFEDYNAANRTVTETFSLYNDIEETTQQLLDREQAEMRASVAAIRGDSARLTRFVVIGASAAIVLSLAIAFWFGSSLRRPIRSVALGLQQMAGGQGDLTERLSVGSRDEVGQVASGFNDFTEMLAGMMRNLKSSVKTLTESGEALAANAEETAASISQINSSVQSVGGLVEQQSESVQSSTSAVEEISRNIENLNEMIESQSASVSQSTASIEEMVANVRSVTERVGNVKSAMQTLEQAAGTGRERMDRVSREIEQVAGKSDLLLETNSVLANIAAQTNLLSMNAAIEAAHAGDAGSGFAVVAAEIRKLAENATEQSQSIADRLKEVKGSIDQIVTSARDADSTFGQVRDLVQQTSELQTEVTHAMEEQAAGGQQVLEGLSQINEITDQVKTGSDEMQTGSQSVAEQMTRLRELSMEVGRAMQEIESGTSEIENGVSELQSTSLENHDIVQRLAKEAEQFKT